MKVSKRPELVIEFVRTQRVRRRAPLHSRICRECGGLSDFVSLFEAAKLFDICEQEILRFTKENACHINTETPDVHLCLVTFLEAMKSRTANFKLIEGSS
jgi:hypothetical protein